MEGEKPVCNLRRSEDGRRDGRSILGRKHEGYVVDKLIVEEAVNIEHEYYSSVIVDDDMQIPVLIFSPEEAWI